MQPSARPLNQVRTRKLIETLRDDLHSGLRNLRRHPTFSLTIAATLSIAIGATVGVFGVIDRLMIRPLPFAHQEQLFFVENSWPLFVDGANTSALTRADGGLTHLARYEFGRATVEQASSARSIKLARVSGDFFQTLGVSPRLGRVFSGDDAQRGDNNVIIVSSGLSRRMFSDDASIVGQVIAVNGRRFTIAGIMPDDFVFYDRGQAADAWVPLVKDDQLLNSAQVEGGGAITRVRNAASLSSAQSRIDVVLRQLSQSRPDLKLGDRDLPRLIPLRDYWFGALRTPLFMLLGAGGFLLTIACANAAGLMLARSAARQREIAVRVALGASRARLVRETLAESLILGLVAAAIGVVLAHWGARAMLAISPIRIPRADEFGVDLRGVLFAAVVSLPAAGLSGLIAISRATRADFGLLLKAAGRSGRFLSYHTRRWLIVAQVAITILLLLDAALLLKSFRNLRHEATGFDPHRVLTIELAPPATQFPDRPSRLAYYERIVSAVRDLPGVASAGLVNYLPFYSGSFIMPVTAPQSSGARDAGLSWSMRVASPDYFRAMRISLVAGRLFTDADRMQSQGVAVIDHSSAELLAAGRPIESVLGSEIGITLGEPMRFRVIGIVADIRQQGFGIPVYPGFYLSALQRPPSVGNLVVRTTAEPAAVLNTVRDALRRADASLPVGSLRLLEDDVTDSISRRRFAVFLSGILSAAALVLSIVGLYALVSQLVAHRTHEIGVRVALGARSHDVVQLVLAEGLTVVAIGVVGGLLVSLATTRLLAGLLYGIGTTDPVTFAAVPALFIGVAVAACGVPVRRALRANPVEALRAE